MKVWIEHEKDAFNYFYFLKKEKKTMNSRNIPQMSVLSVNASNICGYSDKKEFIEKCKNQIINIYNNNLMLHKLKFYLFINQEIINPKSRVENYLKIWKSIGREKNINNFVIGKEITTQIGKELYFSSLAEIHIEYVDIAIEIVSSKPQKSVLFMSESMDINSTQCIEQLTKSISDDFGDINYSLFILKCCTSGNIALRYGTTFEEAEIALVYNSEKIKINI